MAKCRSIALLCLTAACGAPDAREADPAPSLEAVRAELLEMVRVDQDTREGFGTAAATNDTVFMKRMLKEDSAHTRRLIAILDSHGWPGRSRVGDAAANAAWLIVQHSPDHEFQKSILELLRQPEYRDEVDPGDLALLTDRVRGHEGLPQIYGSQFDIVDGALVIPPIEDAANVDARRAAVGLPPMEEYIRQVEAMTGLTLKK